MKVNIKPLFLSELQNSRDSLEIGSYGYKLVNMVIKNNLRSLNLLSDILK